MKTACIIALLILAACSTTPAQPACIALRPWSDIEQNNLLAEFQALPADSEFIPLMIDYERLRAESRACERSSK